ncbi:lysine exporter LysO family protein [Aquitalea sp. LB_tupeE]|nr:lysine exporter LysO family protein [Aquitalea sp. LB_tupeE]
MGTALIFASFTSLLPWGLIVLCMRQPRSNNHSQPAERPPGTQFLHALRDCLLALSMVGMGAMASRFQLGWLDAISTSQLLYLLIVLVGIDLAELKLGSAWRKPEVMVLPLLVIIGSLAGGMAAAAFTGESVWTSLALSSGFGWVTLSSILVSSKLGSSYGAIAMMTDLFRELMAIAMLYLLGARFSREAIGICGATALDATLPLIRQKCGTHHVTLALISGFVLTLVSPVLIMISLA